MLGGLIDDLLQLARVRRHRLGLAALLLVQLVVLVVGLALALRLVVDFLLFVGGLQLGLRLVHVGPTLRVVQPRLADDRLDRLGPLVVDQRAHTVEHQPRQVPNALQLGKRLQEDRYVVRGTKKKQRETFPSGRHRPDARSSTPRSAWPASRRRPWRCRPATP